MNFKNLASHSPNIIIVKACAIAFDMINKGNFFRETSFHLKEKSLTKWETFPDCRIFENWCCGLIYNNLTRWEFSDGLGGGCKWFRVSVDWIRLWILLLWAKGIVLLELWILWLIWWLSLRIWGNSTKFLLSLGSWALLWESLIQKLSSRIIFWAFHLSRL